MSVKQELVSLFFYERPGNRGSQSAMGHVLKQERIRQGHTLKAAAGSVGVTSAYISQLENGRRLNPTFRIINDYSDFLELVLRMKITEIPGDDGMDALISEIEDTLKTLRAIRKIEKGGHSEVGNDSNNHRNP